MMKLKYSHFWIPLTILSSILASCSQDQINCAGQPWNDLKPEDVTALTLNNGEAEASGIAHRDRSTGFSFSAEAAQRLDYQTEANICLWVFTPDNRPLTSGNLPTTGTYLIQVAALQGSQTFDLSVSLDANKRAENPSGNPSPEPSSNTSSSSLTQAEAAELVTRWLESKPKIFGPPFDENLLRQLTTGKTYENNLGSIAWLRNNGYRYVYTTSRIENVWSFFSSSSEPFITVSVYEDLTLYSPRGIDRSKSGASTRNFIYYFAKDSNGQWKISDYGRDE